MDDTDRQELSTDEQLTRDRLTDITEARRTVREVRNKTIGMSPAKAHRAFRRAVESFLYELFPYSDVDESARQLWYQEPIGTVRIDPPPLTDGRWWTDHWPDTRDNCSTGEPPVLVTEPEKVARKTNYHDLQRQGEEVDEITGLTGVLDAPEQYSKTFVLRVDKRHGSHSHTETVAKPLPRPIIETAYERAVMFASDIGLDLEPDQNHHGKT